MRATASTPSPFVIRMRKFLRSRRVTSVAQVGTDRIIELQFSDGQFRLFLEFYAGGNIVLTTQDLSIIALFRAVTEGTGQEQLRVGLKYSLENRQNLDGLPPLTVERVKLGLQEFLIKASRDTAVSSQKVKKKPGDALRKALATIFHEFSPALLDHTLRIANFDAKTRVEDVVENEKTLHDVCHALREAQRINGTITGSNTGKGYIIAKAQKSISTHNQNKQSDASSNDERKGLFYEEFHPFRPRQYEETDSAFTILEFDGFNKTVDEFFSSVESQKLESRIVEREEHARNKLENAKQDHERRLGGLQEVQELNVRKAQAIEAHLQRVQEATTAVNSLVAQGIGWPEIAKLIETEQQRKNPVAEIIRLPLKLNENTVTLLLTEADFEDDPDFEGNETGSDVSDSEDEDYKPSRSKSAKNLEHKRFPVDIDLGLSPWSNARQYYDQKKTAAHKEQRTIQSSEKALKSTESKITADLKKGLTQEKELLRPQRSPYWFEKFIYFISSEGYLVLSGKDAQQSDIIYAKHFTKGDAYVHADLQGAASTIIKNKSGQTDRPIPPSTLSQAGTLAICTSSAWDSKAVMSAWWVNADQVSKISQVGEFLPPGIFAIKGDKKFLPPAQLLLGIGLMFKISEDSKVQHFKHRLSVIPEASSIAMVASDDTSDLQDVGIGDPSDHHEDSKESDERRLSDAKENDHEEAPLDMTPAIHDEKESSQDESDLDNSLYNPLQPNGVLRGVSTQAASDILSAPSSDSENSDRIEALENLTEEAHGITFKESEPDAQNSVRHVSAHERRLLRKGQQPSGSEKPFESATPATPTLDVAVPGDRSSSKEANNQPQVRGKRGKHNKIKTKYADQDDEERALAMRLLGSASAQKKAQEESEATTNKEEKKADERERRRKQQNLASQKGKEAEGKRQRLFQEGLEKMDDGDAEKEVDLEAFVGVALPGDEILDALVLCGPWDAIGGRCRWKAKLQPGSTKKGKAVKEVLGAWVASLKAGDKRKQPGGGDSSESVVEEGKVRMREAELIRAIRESDVVGAVPVGKVRVMMGAIDGGASKGRGGGIAGRGRRGGRGSKRK